MLDHPIARFENLKVEFQTQDGPVEAVKGVSFDIAAGETVVIVGESGSGKSVSSLSLMRLVEYGGGDQISSVTQKTYKFTQKHYRMQN